MRAQQLPHPRFVRHDPIVPHSPQPRHYAPSNVPRTLPGRLAQRLAQLEADGLRRRLPAITHREGHEYTLDGRRVVGLCSNDYLGLAWRKGGPDPGATQPTEPANPGAAASRLVCGDAPEHRDLERTVAAWLGTEDAILFPSGFQANVGALPALLDPTDHVYSDELNHASLIDGMRLAAPRPSRLAHRHAPPPPTSTPSPPLRWWVAESIYSMDGDRSPVDAMRSHLEQGGALYLDEAHAAGLFEGGRGLAAHAGLHPDVLVLPLGKAFGVQGAFIATDAVTGQWLRTRARSFVFSTGISPLLVGAIHRAFELVTGTVGDAARARLWENVAHVDARLGVRREPSPILPLIVGDNHDALAASQALLERGWHVQPIRPPTVPPGAARLRVTLTAAHTIEQLERFCTDLQATFDQLDLPLRLAPSPDPDLSATG